MSKTYTEEEMNAAQAVGEAYGVSKERERIEFLFKAYQQYFPFNIDLLVKLINDENIGRLLIETEEEMFHEGNEDW